MASRLLGCTNAAALTPFRMIERHGGLLLLLGGAALLIAGIAGSEATTQLGFGAMGAALLVLAAVLSRMEGALKIGPAGLEAEVRAAQREAIDGSRALKAALENDGLDLLAVATGRRPDAGGSEAATVQRELSALLEQLSALDAARVPELDPVPAQALREAALGLMARDDWESAATYLDRYADLVPDDWEALYARAVAHSNTRGGPGSDLAALRAYNEALTHVPNDVDENLLARLLSYRAAMLKRLHRLVEAEADLTAAERVATNPYEKADIDYNLACVYSMTGRREAALARIDRLKGTQYISAIRAHLDDYFASLAGDAEFEALVGAS